METDPFVAALQKLCSQNGGVKSVADKAKVSDGNLSQIVNGTLLPSGNPRGVGPRLRKELSKAFPHWLDVEHQSSSETPAAPSAQETPAVYSQKIATDLVIKQYPNGGGMGHGVVLEEKQPGIIRSWNVSGDWLRLNVPHYTSAGNLCIVTGFGPSMKPLYNPGDPLLMDRGITEVDQEGVFFFRLGELGYIKQLQRIPTEDGLVLRAKSLNPSYEPFNITRKMRDDFQCFGKILTVWRSEQV